MGKIFCTTLLSFVLFSCSNDSQTVESVSSGMDGEKLMVKNCNSCHNPSEGQQRQAPPMSHVKGHYITEGMTKKEFTEAIVAWVENPNEEDSQMPGARRKFGLMPNQEFNHDELIAITQFMYDHDLDQQQSCCGGSCSCNH